MARTILTMTLVFLILARASAEKSNGFLTALEENLESKLTDYMTSLAKWLEGFNDKYLGRSELGRLLHYDQIKTKLEETGRRRSIKSKMGMGMAMLPLVFHVGATSTWMILTTIMAAKSVAIGIALLVFKIAVSSAKVAAFFTSLKGKHSDHHHGWAWSPHEHHGHERSLAEIVPHIAGPDLHSYSPDWSPNVAHDYKTIPTYKEYSEHNHDGPFQAVSYIGDAKTIDH